MPSPLIAFENITKRFPGTTALHDVSFSIEKGACHALVGENGAGKSTLGKILAGIYTHDEGQMLLDGRPVSFTDPREALECGVAIAHQELAFCENLSVAENLNLGRLPSTGGLVSWREVERRALDMLAPFDVDIDVSHPIGELPVGLQQLAQIASALHCGARIIVFDEPTASLTPVERERLFEQIHRLRQQGVTIVYISHHLDEIFRLCDAITVLRDGQHVTTQPADSLDQDTLIGLMIGRTLANYFPEHGAVEPGAERLRVEGLGLPGKYHDISFSLRSGEILGLAGLVGAGRTELLEGLFGVAPPSAGRMFIDGSPASVRRPVDAMRLGMGLIPEDRKRRGLIGAMTVRDNVALPTMTRRSWMGWMNSVAETRFVRRYVETLQIRAAGLDAPAENLSGGNQQKLILARWLGAQCRILLIDEPTRGVDVGAKAEIHALINRLAREGCAIVLSSSELEEIINLSTRILALRKGRVAGTLTREEATRSRLMAMMAGIA